MMRWVPKRYHDGTSALHGKERFPEYASFSRVGLASDATPINLRFAPARRRVLLVYAVAHDLGRALLRLARKAPLDGHARQQLVLDEAVGLLLGLPHGGDEDASVCRPSGVVGLSLGQTSRRVHRRNACLVLIHGCARAEMRQQVCHVVSFSWVRRA